MNPILFILGLVVAALTLIVIFLIIRVNNLISKVKTMKDNQGKITEILQLHSSRLKVNKKGDPNNINLN